MKIVVTVKQVPDVNAAHRLDRDHRLVRDADLVLDAGDECGVEIALQLAEVHGGEVVIVSMGPVSARDAVRKALSMGAHRGVLVVDDQLAGADALQTARTLAAAIAPERADLVICGTESSDGSTGVVPSMLAELLGLPLLTLATSVVVAGDLVTIHRRTENGVQVVEAPTPALLTVTAAIAEPRYPTLKNVMTAKSKPIAQVTLADLGVSSSDPVETIEAVIDAPSRPGGEIVEDDGTSGIAKILERLVSSEVA